MSGLGPTVSVSDVPMIMRQIHQGRLVSKDNDGQDGELLAETSERLCFICRRRGSLPYPSTLSCLRSDFGNNATVVAGT